MPKDCTNESIYLSPTTYTSSVSPELGMQQGWAEGEKRLESVSSLLIEVLVLTHQPNRK